MPIPITKLYPSYLSNILGRRLRRRLGAFLAARLVGRPGDTVVFPECTGCHSEFAVPVDPFAYRLHDRTALTAQEAFPNLHPADRELFISGLCHRCFAAAVFPARKGTRALRRAAFWLTWPVHRFRRK